MFFLKNKNFCDMNPLFWKISKCKCMCVRYIKDATSNVTFAKTKQKEKLVAVVSEYQSTMIKKGKGIDPVTQENKAINIQLASSKINGIIIRPGEVFSFWKLVGNATKKQGYMEGRVIIQNKLVTDTGGGLCNLANTINNLILRSPLQIVEFHKHSDALACDIGHRIPMSNGTSISYNYIDYRFQNTTDQTMQLLLWCEDGILYGQLRSEREIPETYEISEENHHFEKNKDKYYRVSKIYKETLDKKTGKCIKKDLIWDNHSLVLFDPALIPDEMIKGQ